MYCEIQQYLGETLDGIDSFYAGHLTFKGNLVCLLSNCDYKIS